MGFGRHTTFASYENHREELLDLWEKGKAMAPRANLTLCVGDHA